MSKAWIVVCLAIIEYSPRGADIVFSAIFSAGWFLIHTEITFLVVTLGVIGEGLASVDGGTESLALIVALQKAVRSLVGARLEVIPLLGWHVFPLVWIHTSPFGAKFEAITLSLDHGDLVGAEVATLKPGIVEVGARVAAVDFATFFLTSIDVGQTVFCTLVPTSVDVVFAVHNISRDLRTSTLRRLQMNTEFHVLWGFI